MKPEELAEMSKSAMQAVKEQLSSGTVTKKEVEELEKIMGVNIKDFAKLLQSGKVDKQKLKELGPDFSDMLDIFKKLAEIQ